MFFRGYTVDKAIKAMLIYLCETHPNIQNVEMADTQTVGHMTMESTYVDWEKDFQLYFFAPGVGQHEVVYRDVPLKLRIKQRIGEKGDEHMYHGYDWRHAELYYEVYLEGEGLTTDLIQAMVEDARVHIEKKFKEHTYAKKVIKKFVYNSSEGFWDLMNNQRVRSLDTLFLKKGERDAVFDFVKDFLEPETQEEYHKFNVPYKCNIMLHGRPGTGKTSTILAVASELQLNVGLIPICPKLTDTRIIHAMNSVKKYDCKIIVLEDIDCLFSNRKEGDVHKNALTLSGLLNCMDGLFRNEGVIVFMTANTITCLDEAMTRACRVDLKLYYDWADEFQARACFDFYFPGREAERGRFLDFIQFKQYTIAMLQQFFFKNRKCKRITDHLDELEKIIGGKSTVGGEETETEGKVVHLYM